MSQKVLNTKLLHRIGTTTEWTNENAASQILANGEIGFERTLSGSIKFKVGNGNTPWNSLLYSDAIQVLSEKFKYPQSTPISSYESSDDTIPNYSILKIENDNSLTHAEKEKLYSLCSNNTNIFYLNSLDFPLQQSTLDPSLFGMDPDHHDIYVLAFNINAETFEKYDNNKDFYIIQLILTDYDQEAYWISLMTSNLENPPASWTIFQLESNDINKTLYLEENLKYKDNKLQVNENFLYNNLLETNGNTLIINGNLDIHGTLTSDNSIGSNLTIDQTVTSGSSNPVSSNGIYSYGENIKQQIPSRGDITSNNTGWVTGGEIYNYCEIKIPTGTADLTNNSGFLTPATLFNYVDNTPIQDSPNLIKSGGVYTAINEIMQVANGKTACYVFDTVQQMNDWLNLSNNKASLHTGDVFLIRALNVPDYWWDGTADNGNGGVSQLETTKVDLTDYALVSAIPTNNNQLTNGAGYITSSALTIDNIDVGDYLIISGGNASSFTLT